MSNKIKKFLDHFLKKDLPEIRPGDLVRIWWKIKEVKRGDKKKKEEKVQPFEGTVIAKKHGKGISSTITLRSIIEGVGVERIFPLHSPLIKKIEIIAKRKARRAKLYYIREKSAKEIRKKLKPRK
jgi:large subunit ribosomal protein L19